MSAATTTTQFPPAPYYLRDKNGEPMMGYPDIYEGRQALNTMPPGTELVRAEDGVVVSVMYSASILPFTFRKKVRK